MNNESSSFELLIDFEPSWGDPARTFDAMSGLVTAFSSLDRHLLSSIDSGLRADLVLADVQRGSLRALLKSLLSDLPDEALKDADWRKILGHYLLKAKYAILKWCEAGDAPVTKERVAALEDELARLAEETNVKMLPAYARIPTEHLLHDVQRVQLALGRLADTDSAEYRSAEGSVALRKGIELSPELIREILTSEVAQSHLTTSILVKKPDYLGRSQWSFQFQGHKMDAAIQDKEWLGRFQARLLDVRPGDSLKVELLQRIFFGYDGQIVFRQYVVEHVLDVIRAPFLGGQSDAFDVQ